MKFTPNTQSTLPARLQMRAALSEGWARHINGIRHIIDESNQSGTTPRPEGE